MIVTVMTFNPRRLTALRKAAGYPSQRALATRLGMSQQVVNNWETGLSAPSAKALLALVQALDCELGDLYGPDPVPAE